MSKVSLKEDILKEAIEKLPDIDPELVSKIFDSSIDYINELASNPEIYQIHITEKLGYLTSNYYMNRYNRSKNSRKRYNNMNEELEELEKVKVMHVPYIIAMYKQATKIRNFRFSLDYRSYLDMLEVMSAKTNEKYDKEVNGNS